MVINVERPNENSTHLMFTFFLAYSKAMPIIIKIKKIDVRNGKSSKTLYGIFSATKVIIFLIPNNQEGRNQFGSSPPELILRTFT